MRRRSTKTVAIASLTACSVLLPSLAPTAQAAVTIYTTHIVLNGHMMTSPPAFTYDKTLYMPIYYVNEVLAKLGIAHAWDGASNPQTWKLTTPDGGPLQLSLQATSGKMRVLVNGQVVEDHVVTKAEIDPSTHKYTTFVPIWYIQQVLKALGITNPWDGHLGARTWTLSTYTAYAKSGSLLGSFLTQADAKQALTDYSGGWVLDPTGKKVYTQPAFANVDLRYPAPAAVTAGSINAFLTNHPSPLAGLGATVIKAQADYGVDANYLVSHAIEESGWGTSSIAIDKNNLYGYGATDQSNGSAAAIFPSEAYAILFQAFEVRTNYLTPSANNYGGAPTLTGMNVNYASDPNWATNIDTIMDQFALGTSTTVSNYTQYSPQNTPPAPVSTSEPVYRLNGAMATTSAPWTSNYSGAPVFSDQGRGASDLFTRDLTTGDAGPDVETLQTVLNQQDAAGLTVDGQFGATTEAAVKTAQQNASLSPTGVVDFNLWSNVLHIPGPQQELPAGQTVQVDQISEGMVGGNVSEWMHLVTGGWVPGSALTWTNAYRLTVADPTNPADVAVSVLSPSNPSQVIATLRAGDTVVANQALPQSGYMTIAFVDPASGTTQMGLVAASKVSLQLAATQ